VRKNVVKSGFVSRLDFSCAVQTVAASERSGSARVSKLFLFMLDEEEVFLEIFRNKN